MIRTTLEFIQNELEAYIVEREQDLAHYSPGHVVDLKSIITPGGEVNLDDNFHITIMLVGLEEERREGKRPVFVERGKHKLKLNPPVELDLFVLFVAHQTNYETALRDLSGVISFFQSSSVFDEQRCPSLNSTVIDPQNKPWRLIEKLIFNLYSLSFEQQNNLWAMLGSKYIPSVVYKMKMLSVFDNRSKEKATPITELNFNEND
ncbi:MAG TPA: DUF4255 domain-containing protein [Chitinophagaceae bacterium]